MTTLTLRDPWRYPFADFDGLFRTFGTEVGPSGFPSGGRDHARG